MITRIIKLEERILFDAAAPAAVLLPADGGGEAPAEPNIESHGDNGGGDHVDAQDNHVDAQDNHVDIQENAEAEAEQAPVLQLLVVSNEVEGADQIAQSAKDGVVVVRYDSDDSLDNLYSAIESHLEGQQADSIAIASHGKDGSFLLVDGAEVSLSHLQGDEQLTEFWDQIGSLIKEGGRLDLLGCNIAESDTSLLDELSIILERDVAASTDMTGNNGGDWFLEAGGVNALGYFTSAIDSWQGSLFSNLGTVFTVTNTNDSGAGSFDQAIIDSNAHLELIVDGENSHLEQETILFNIDEQYRNVNGAFIINDSSLPQIESSNLFIRGNSDVFLNGDLIFNGDDLTIGRLNIEQGSITLNDSEGVTIREATMGFDHASVLENQNGIALASASSDVQATAIFINGGQDISITQSTIGYYQDNIYLDSSTNINIADNLINIDPGSGNNDYLATPFNANTAIYSVLSNDVEIAGNTIGGHYGNQIILFETSNNLHVMGNELISSFVPIETHMSSGTIEGNNIHDFFQSGILSTDSELIIDGNTISAGITGVYLFSSNDTQVTNNIFNEIESVNIDVDSSHRVLLDGNTIGKTPASASPPSVYGIYAEKSEYLTINNNTIFYVDTGISLLHSTKFTSVTNNEIYQTDIAIDLEGFHNRVTGNLIGDLTEGFMSENLNNHIGIRVESTEDALIDFNHFARNQEAGIYVTDLNANLTIADNLFGGTTSDNPGTNIIGIHMEHVVGGSTLITRNVFTDNISGIRFNDAGYETPPPPPRGGGEPPLPPPLEVAIFDNQFGQDLMGNLVGVTIINIDDAGEIQDIDYSITVEHNTFQNHLYFPVNPSEVPFAGTALLLIGNQVETYDNEFQNNTHGIIAMTDSIIGDIGRGNLFTNNVKDIVVLQFLPVDPHVTILGNHFDNDSGIDLATYDPVAYANGNIVLGDGRTFNDIDDLDTGANDLHNFPNIEEVIIDEAFNMHVLAYLDGEPGETHRVDFYANTDQLDVHAGTIFVTTNSEAEINFSTSILTLPQETNAIYATATGSNGSTSELSFFFSVNFPAFPGPIVPPTPPPPPIVDGGVVEVHQGVKPDTIERIFPTSEFTISSYRTSDYYPSQGFINPRGQQQLTSLGDYFGFHLLAEDGDGASFLKNKGGFEPIQNELDEVLLALDDAHLSQTRVFQNHIERLAR